MQTRATARKSSSEGKVVKKSRRQYTKEYKREAVRLSRDPPTSPSQVARDLGLSRSLLSSWGEAASTEGADAFRGQGKRKAMEAEIASLKRRNRVLEEERDILKKAATWFAKQSE